MSALIALLIQKIALSENKELAQAVHADLFDICDREHSSCNNECPIYDKYEGIPRGDSEGECPCFKNGILMFRMLLESCPDCGEATTTVKSNNECTDCSWKAYVPKSPIEYKKWLCYHELHVDDRTFHVHSIIEADNKRTACDMLIAKGCRGDHYHLQAKGCLGEYTSELAEKYINIKEL